MADTSTSARNRGTLLLAVIFFLGMVCGASLFYMGQRSVSGRAGPDRRAREMPGRQMMDPADVLAKTLDLDPEQRRQLAETLQLRREQLREMMEQTNQEIREQLRPDQQEKFDSLRPRHRGRSGRFPRGGRGGSPRGGPGGSPRHRPAPPPPDDGG